MSKIYVGSCLDCLTKSLPSFSRSANGQGHVAGDGPKGHVPFFFLEIVVAAEDVTSVAEKEMNGRSESIFW